MTFRHNRWPETAEKIRTLWFLAAMIPLMLIAGFVGVVSLVLTSPLMVYAGIRGKHLKDPWRNSGKQAL